MGAKGGEEVCEECSVGWHVECRWVEIELVG